jgi:hypothetical protein
MQSMTLTVFMFFGWMFSNWRRIGGYSFLWLRSGCCGR